MDSKRTRTLIGLLLAVLLISILSAAAPQSMPDLVSARAAFLGLFFTRECQGQSAMTQPSGGSEAVIPACWLSQELVTSP